MFQLQEALLSKAKETKSIALDALKNLFSFVNQNKPKKVDCPLKALAVSNFIGPISSLMICSRWKASMMSKYGVS